MARTIGANTLMTRAELMQTELVEVSGTTHTLQLTDAFKMIQTTSSSATVITIPQNSSVAFPIGTSISGIRWGSGTVTIDPDSGVTMNSADGADKARVQYSTWGLDKIDTDIWFLYGDITT